MKGEFVMDNNSNYFKKGKKFFSRKNFLILQGIHILCFLLFIGPVSTSVLFSSGLICAFFYGILVIREILDTPSSISPFICYMVAGTIRIGLATCWVASAYFGGYKEILKHGIFYIGEELMYGHAIQMIGDWFFISGYTLWSNKKEYNMAEKKLPIAFPHIMLRNGCFLIFFGWLFQGIIILGVELKSIGLFFSYLIYYSSPAGLFLLFFSTFNLSKYEKTKVLIAICPLFIIEFILSLKSYMKSTTMILLIPLVFYFIEYAKIYFDNGNIKLSMKRLAPIFIIMLFVIMILFPYSEIRRNHFWEGGYAMYTPEVSSFLKEVAEAAIPGTTAFSSLHEFPNKGFWAFISRHSQIIGTSWVYQYVSDHGHADGMFIKEAFIAVIPRIIWKEKPIIMTSRAISVIIGIATSAETATTATDIGGMSGALYFNWGISCLIIGMFINGIILSFTWNIFRIHIFNNPIAAFVMMILLLESARYFESSFSGNIEFYLYIFIVFFPLFKIVNMLFYKSKSN
jgi:hypothetical protein